MANLNSQNIGLNYKGILNLNTLNGNLSGTLQAVTDGDGNASPLQLSTTKVNISTRLGIGAEATTQKLYIENDWTIDYSENSWFTIYDTAFASALKLVPIEVGVGTGFTLLHNTTQIIKGNSSYVKIPLSLMVGSTSNPSARLHVRGDGTNPIARFDNGAGTQVAQMSDNGVLNYFTNNSGIGFYGTGIFFINSGLIHDYTTNGYHRFRGLDTVNGTKIVGIESNCGKSIAGSTTFRPLNIEYTINNSAAQTGTATGIFLNATETALNGMAHNLLDLQVGGVSKFKVDNTGFLTTSSAIIINGYISLPSNASISFSGQSQIFNSSDGVIRLTNDAGTSFNRLQFGGTTNAFPAIKRNGAGIEFRLADDSGHASITASKLILPNTTTGTGLTMGEAVNNSSNYMNSGTGGGWLWYFTTGDNSYNSTKIRMNIADEGVCIGNTGMTAGTSASASLEIRSIDRGFLPPRMTTTQVNAITSPAEGLVVFNTTISHLCVYQSGAWVRMSHSPM